MLGDKLQTYTLNDPVVKMEQQQTLQETEVHIKEELQELTTIYR